MKIPRPYPGVLAVAILVAGAGAARADVRIWEEEPVAPEVAGEARAGRADREVPYVDLTAWAQPSFVWRQGPDPNQLLLRDARVGVEGLPYPWLRFRLELAAGTTHVFPVLADAWLDAELLEDALHVRAGHQRFPFLRTLLYAEALQVFAQRPMYAERRTELPTSLVDRNVGVLVHGTIGDVDFGPTFEYGIGVFEGRRGREDIVPAGDGTPLLAGRLQVHLTGVPVGEAAENDLARSERPRVAVGGGVLVECEEATGYGRGFTADLEGRWRGLYAAAGFVRLRRGRAAEGSPVADSLDYSDNCAAAVLDRVDEEVFWGAHLQAQYVLPRLLFPIDGQALEVLARFGMVQPHREADGSLLGRDRDGAAPAAVEDADRWRLTLGLNWYPTEVTLFRLSAQYQLQREAEDVLVGAETEAELRNDVLWLQLTAGL